MSKTNVSEISKIIEDKIKNLDIDFEVSEVGKVISYADGIAQVHGLKNAMSYEMVEFENGERGLAMNLEEDSVGVVILDSSPDIREGMSVKRLKELMSVPVGEAVLGRIINSLGDSIDGKGSIATKEHSPVEVKAPGIMDRKSVFEPLQTGLKAIDALVPIGRGQRELIIGDRQTGKTTVAIDTIINQKGKDVICIYVAIGQKESTVAQVAKKLEEVGALEYSVIVDASSSSSAAMQFLAPYVGATIAEYFMNKGQHTLVVYDDLSKHANAYREMSLILRRPPGREAYPGDVFYLHSRLLERAAKLSDERGGGSMTALPVIETQAGDVSAYIPTNVISITDGQIYLETDLFNSGVRPAINAGLSVSRVGGAAQTKAMKKVAGNMRLDLAQYRELEAFSQFASDLDATSRSQLERGERMVEVLKQGPYTPVPLAYQVFIMFAGVSGMLDAVAVKDVLKFEKEFREYVDTNHKKLVEKVSTEKKLEDDSKEELTKAIESFLKVFKAS